MKINDLPNKRFRFHSQSKDLGLTPCMRKLSVIELIAPQSRDHIRSDQTSSEDIGSGTYSRALRISIVTAAIQVMGVI